MCLDFEPSGRFLDHTSFEEATTAPPPPNPTQFALFFHLAATRWTRERRVRGKSGSFDTSLCMESRSTFLGNRAGCYGRPIPARSAACL